MKKLSIILMVLLISIIMLTGACTRSSDENPGDTAIKPFTNSLGMKFIYIKPGTFMMGTPAKTWETYSNEPQHSVTLTKGFYMQTTEVTQRQWKQVMGTRPWSGKYYVRGGDNYPALYISWNDAQSFIRKLNLKEEDDKYRLPSEAQWEYACRAGSTAVYYFGNNEYRLGEYAWYYENAWIIGYANYVARKKPNDWGLYDMHGNALEWCQDWKASYPSNSVTDPTGPSSGSYRVLRGGGWCGNARECRSANRDDYSPYVGNRYIGFRLSRAE